jgi:hypothetical protein
MADERTRVIDIGAAVASRYREINALLQARRTLLRLRHHEEWTDKQRAQFEQAERTLRQFGIAVPDFVYLSDLEVR